MKLARTFVWLHVAAGTIVRRVKRRIVGYCASFIMPLRSPAISDGTQTAVAYPLPRKQSEPFLNVTYETKTSQLTTSVSHSH